MTGSVSYPVVSIGIPTYNRADGYLRDTLESALKQNYSNMEIIVSDNCSADNTESFVRGICDPRVRYFRQKENISQNENFNFCLDQAEGDYFLLLHDDDLIDEDFVAICLERADHRTDFGIIRTGTRLIDSEGSVIRESHNLAEGSSVEELFYSWFNNRTSFYFCNTLFNTKLLKRVGGFHSKHNFVEDCTAILKLAARSERLDVKETKASFRIHSNYIKYGSKVRLWAEDFLWLLDRICEIASENHDLLRSEGERFFAGLSYKRAAIVQSPFKRLIAYLTVFRMFKYRYAPPPLARLIRRSLPSLRKSEQ